MLFLFNPQKLVLTKIKAYTVYVVSGMLSKVGIYRRHVGKSIRKDSL